MNKIISLHPFKCETKCPNSKVCYHLNRWCEKRWDHKKIQSLCKEAYRSDNDVHIAVCNFNEARFVVYNMLEYSNINMTISINVYNKLVKTYDPISKKTYGELLNECKDRLQVTVYYIQEIIDLKNDFQKLYLIKSEATFIVAKWLMKKEAVKNIHFPIAQDWASKNKDKLEKLIVVWTRIKDKSITIDSCLENYLMNGRCGYIDNYIDINYDITVRRCPFEVKGTSCKDMSIDDMFKVEHKPSCIYHKLLGDKNESMGTK